MIPASFDYRKASSVAEAIQLLQEHGDEAKLLSGGHSLIPAMKLRMNRPGILIDIGGIAALKDIKEEGDHIVIGANCTHKQVMNSDLVKREAGVVAQAAACIGDVQVKNRGTIGGSVAHADPAADYPAALIAAGATINVAGKNGNRSIPVEDFFQGMFYTALEADEIILSISVPKGSNGSYMKFPQPASRFALVGVAVVKNGGAVRIGVTGAADTPYRAKEAEAQYADKGTGAAEYVVAGGVEMMEDHHATAAYRAQLAKVMAKRALERV
ncbi:MAG TPA: xanthine dehydrogenase family protein subunit M [Phaeodactylibacter sp.]|nr:xanthine dehydrogenase family protein subunit M [Phaeodactylibacter sp.]